MTIDVLNKIKRMQLKTLLCVAKASVAAVAPSENKALHDNVIITQNKLYVTSFRSNVYKKKLNHQSSITLFL